MVDRTVVHDAQAGLAQERMSTRKDCAAVGARDPVLRHRENPLCC
jgi:hypothetical protein